MTDKKFWILCLKGIDRQCTGVLLRFQYFTWSPNVKISSVLDVETACQKVRFFKCKKWLALTKNIWAKDKRKYYSNYYLPHWGQNKFKQLVFGVLRGVIYVLFWQIALFVCPTRTKIKILWWRRYFSEVQSLRKEILTIKLHVLLLGNYFSLH